MSKYNIELVYRQYNKKLGCNEYYWRIKTREDTFFVLWFDHNRISNAMVYCNCDQAALGKDCPHLTPLSEVEYLNSFGHELTFGLHFLDSRSKRRRGVLQAIRRNSSYPKPDSSLSWQSRTSVRRAGMKCDEPERLF